MVHMHHTTELVGEGWGIVIVVNASATIRHLMEEHT